MPVNSRVFGDPCPGTNKYVEVHYACAAKNKATTKVSKRLYPTGLFILALGAQQIRLQTHAREHVTRVPR